MGSIEGMLLSVPHRGALRRQAATVARGESITADLRARAARFEQRYGSGKTRVLAEAARIWAAANLGPVIGITPSQSARNTLAAGVPISYNAVQFLDHLPGRRGAGGSIPIGPGPSCSSTRPPCCPLRTWPT